MAGNPQNPLLAAVKVALRLTVDSYDSELTSLISAAQLDLGIAGVQIPSTIDALVQRAIITYCRIHFSSLTDGEFSRMKAAYDEQKAQLSMANGYTNWGDIT